jgi:hypothetical protein
MRTHLYYIANGAVLNKINVFFLVEINLLSTISPILQVSVVATHITK